jgi:hypothetical protein
MVLLTTVGDIGPSPPPGPKKSPDWFIPPLNRSRVLEPGNGPLKSVPEKSGPLLLLLPLPDLPPITYPASTAARLTTATTNQT